MKLRKPETLDQALQLFRKKRVQLCIGSRGGFCFIGTVEDFDRDVNLLEAYYRYAVRTGDVPEWQPFRKRKIKRWYKRNMPGEPLPQVAIIVTGAESGEVICWYEYAKKLPEYYDRWRVAHPGKRLGKGPIPKAWTWDGIPEKPKNTVTSYDDNWRLLLDAIVVQATKDYKDLYRSRLKRKDHSHDGDIAVIEDFLSGGYTMSQVPAKLRRLVKEEL